MARQFKKIVEEVGSQLSDRNQQTMRQQLQLNIKEFADKVAAFNKLGEALYNGGNFAKLAEELEEIATHAEAYTLRETEGEWFDQVTVKRNMKELKGYSGEFKKVASEARALQERMTALYEDCGRVLGRYFEIKEMGQPDGMTQIAKRSEADKIVNANPGIREGQTCEGCGKPMEACECVNEVAPEGWEGTVKAMKKHKEIDNPWALAHHMKAQGMKSHKKEGMNEAETKCPGCDKPMSQCDCDTHVHEAMSPEEKALRAKHSAEDRKKSPFSGDSAKHRGDDRASRYKHYVDVHKKKGQEPRYKSYSDWSAAQKEGLHEGKLSLKKLMEEVEITDDYPKEDWVKLDVPMLRSDVALEFEKDLKKKGFEVKRHDWKERAAQGEEFSEFFVKKADFDEANKYAVGAYQSYDNNARMEKS